MSPLSNSYVRPEKANAMEPFYPLHAYVCTTAGWCSCKCTRLANIFSATMSFLIVLRLWLAHAKAYTEKMRERFD